jgi:SAM-dependent methyltransferase
MFTQTAQFYDLIYSFKDYAAESERIRALLEAEAPGARTVLDVGCGTGEHARHLCAHYAVDGVDLQPEFVEIARAKVPSGRFELADMREFDLGRHYDIVLCLFGAIAYTQTLDALEAALRCLAKHCRPGGLVLVEPFITPDRWRPGHPDMQAVDREDLKLCRMALSGREGDLAVIRFEYLVGTPRGIEHLNEEHVLGLFPVAGTLAAFERAGLEARHEPEGLGSRGLYVARPAAAGGE